MNIKSVAFFLMIVLLQNGSATAQELDAFGLENMNAVKISTDQAAKNNVKTQKNTAEEKKPNKLESIKKNLKMLVKRGPATMPETDKSQSDEEETLTEEERELAKIMNPEEPKVEKTQINDSQQETAEQNTPPAQDIENIKAEEQPVEQKDASDDAEESKNTAKDERSLEYLMFNMNLSDEQLVKIQKLNEESSQKMAVLMEKIKQLRQEVRNVESASLDSFETILNEEQKEKFKNLRLMYESNRSDIKKLDPDVLSLGE